MYIAIAVLVVLLLSGLRVAQEYQRGAIFRLGHFRGTRGPGLYWIVPLGIERAVTIDIRIFHRVCRAAGDDYARQRDDQSERGALV